MTGDEARAMTPKMVAVLRILRHSTSLTPNEVGSLMARDADPDVRPASGLAGQRHGGTMGPGSMIAPTLTALERRGFIKMVGRSDHLSGSAYHITREGRIAIDELGQQ